MDERVLKLQELLKNEDFVKALSTKEEPEDAQAFFEENGIEFSLDEIREIGAAYQKLADGTLSVDALEKAAKGELSEDELEEVAGGTAVTVSAGLVAGALLEVFGGAAIIGVGTATVVKYKDEIVDGLSNAANEVYNFFRSW